MSRHNVDDGWIVGDAPKRNGREGVLRILCSDDVIERIGGYDVAMLDFVDGPGVLGRTSPEGRH